MAVIVEQYVEAEKTSLIADPEAWRAKVRELGLGRQADIIEPMAQPNPFLRLTPGMVRMVEELTNKKVDITEFVAEPIPMEALELYSVAKTEKYFQKVEIWFSDKDPDPFMIGHIGDRDTEKFLMCRWGEGKKSLDDLMKKARGLWLARQTISLKDRITRAQEDLAKLDLLATKHFAGDYVGLY